MKSLYNNKKARILPRDIVMMMLIFSGVIAFSGILVNQMGTEYDNNDMVSSYDQSDVGKDTLESKSNTWEDIGEDLSGDNGIASLLIGGLKAVGVVLKEVLKAPITFSEMVTAPLEMFGVEQNESGTGAVSLIQILIAGLLYILIIFGIIKVFLQGGDI